MRVKDWNGDSFMGKILFVTEKSLEICLKFGDFFHPSQVSGPSGTLQKV